MEKIGGIYNFRGALYIPGMELDKNWSKTIKFLAEVLLFIFIAYASYLLLLLSLPYLAFERNIEFLQTKQLIYHLDWWRISFYIHVFVSPVVILSGLIQFNKWSFHHFPRIHRVTGYVYVFTVLFLAAPSALLIGLYANGGYLTQISFTILSLFWMISTALAFTNALRGNYVTHTKWMLRSYLLTLSAVTLRLYAYLFDVFNVQIDPITTYVILAYLSWIPNLIIAEILIFYGYPWKRINRSNS